MTDTASHCNPLNEGGGVSHFNLRASFLHIWPFADHFLQKQIPLQVIQCHLNPQDIYALRKANFYLIWMLFDGEMLSPSWKSVAKSSAGLAREEESAHVLHSPKAELHQHPQHANIPNPQRTAALQPTASQSQGHKSGMLQQNGEMWKKRVCQRWEKVWKQVLDEMDIIYTYKSRKKDLSCYSLLIQTILFYWFSVGLTSTKVNYSFRN